MIPDVTTVGITVSLVIALGMAWFWIWAASRIRRRRPGLPAPDRSCTRDWYSVGGMRSNFQQTGDKRWVVEHLIQAKYRAYASTTVGKTTAEVFTASTIKGA